MEESVAETQSTPVTPLKDHDTKEKSPAQTAYEAYATHLTHRTRNWHELKKTANHQDKSDEELDDWIRENKKEELARFSMGTYEAMDTPRHQHTIKGWKAFARNAEQGEEEAWNSYTEAAKVNFHGDKFFPLPSFDALDDDQKAACQYAVKCVLEHEKAKTLRL